MPTRWTLRRLMLAVAVVAVVARAAAWWLRPALFCPDWGGHLELMSIDPPAGSRFADPYDSERPPPPEAW